MLGRVRERRLVVAFGIAGLVAVIAWIAGQQIRSPAQVASQTAPPKASAITVPVEKQKLSSEVIVRGLVRYGSPQPVVLPTSTLKQNSSGAGATDIVTARPKRGSRFSEGMALMSVSGRPVFALRGAQPSHRDIGPGVKGPDVRQLEAALARMGFFPGPVDGRYDGQTAAAVGAWYERSGYTPFGPTDTQIDQLRTAKATAAQARDAFLQSKVAIQQAAQGATTPGEIAQARIDAATARNAITTAVLDLRTARIKALAARDAARNTNAGAVALLNERRDNAAAAADVATKRAALNRATRALAEAQRNLADAPPDTTPSERATLEAAIADATDGISVAQADLNASLTAASATSASGRQEFTKVMSDHRQLVHDAQAAAADVTRARRAIPAARRQASLASSRLRVLLKPGDATLQRTLSSSSSQEANRTAGDVNALAAKMGIAVPANEVVFFPTLPLRVDSVRARRGDSVNGKVMTVSNSRLAIDSDLSINDAKLVRRGEPVKIEEPDLGVTVGGTVTQVADRPGTNQASPDRVYLEVTPNTAPAQLLGTSVKLTIAVNSTQQAVLTVPVTALSVGADGSSRVQVERPNGRAEYVTVVPGLAAKGLVEVRATHGRLAPGDLVIVGDRGAGLPGGAPPAPSPAIGTTPSGGSSAGTTGVSGTTGATSSGRAGSHP
jgi:hypothetical protein